MVSVCIFNQPQSSARCIILVMSVCVSDDNFRKPLCMKFVFAHVVYLLGLQVEFVYEGHRVKVKVTGVKRLKIPIPAV